mgnify:CR=1 FL=1
MSLTPIRDILPATFVLEDSAVDTVDSAIAKLNAKHYKYLVETRQLPADWVLANCRSVTSSQASESLGYHSPSPGILLQGEGWQQQFRPDKPWSSKDKITGKRTTPKYRSPQTAEGGYDAQLPTHPTNRTYWTDLEALKERCWKIDEHPYIILTEGLFKAIMGCAHGLPTIALLGVEMGLTSQKADPQGKRYLVPVLEKYARAGFGFIIAFDADCVGKPGVFKAEQKLTLQLKKFGVPVRSITGTWKQEAGKGMDDFIQNQGIEAFREKLLKTYDLLSLDIAQQDLGNPKEEFLQKALDTLYGEPRWICADWVLYKWVGTHYSLSPDVVELRRIADFCDDYAVVNQETGEVRYPYAKPSKVEELLKWVKFKLSVQPELINPPGLNCTNGVLQIEWHNSTPSWRLAEHSPELYYTYQPLVTYDPNANPEFCNCLLSALDKDQRDVFLKTIAASLDLEKVRQLKGRLVRALLLKGDGSNGKDSFREVVSMMYGRQGMTGATLSDFAAYDGGRKFTLAKLKRSRVNWASENANTSRLDQIQSLKAFITGDSLASERKGKDEEEFTPKGIALFNVNDTPNLRGTLEAIQGRYGVLTFNKTFKIGADPTKGEIEADPRFKYDPGFIQSQVLPAFLNRVLDSLDRLITEGIDYSCTRKALLDIQAENSHLFQFCQDTGLGYDPNGVLTAGEIWAVLEQWYQDNGTLTYEDANGKRKALWIDQARKGDANVKGANQVIPRFQKLFPTAKRISVGKGKMALKGINFVLPSLPGEPVEAVCLEKSGQLVSLQPLSDKDGEPVEAVSYAEVEKNSPNYLVIEQFEEVLQPIVFPQLAHPQELVRDTASLQPVQTASPTPKTASPDEQTWEAINAREPFPNRTSDNERAGFKRATKIREAYAAAQTKEDLEAMKRENGGEFSQEELRWVFNWLRKSFRSEYNHIKQTATISQPSCLERSDG